MFKLPPTGRSWPGRIELFMNETTLAVFGLGFVLGMRHALEPDHVVAVSTIVSANNSIARSSLAGTVWGLGHTASLFICGSVVLALRLSIPAGFIVWMEAAVAIMLVVLGVSSLRELARDWKVHVHIHSHGGRPHIHLHVHRRAGPEMHDHHHRYRASSRSFVIGLVHGLAGSGALMVLVLAAAPSILSGLVYIVLFGLGSIGGMLVLSCIISIPFALSAHRYRMFNNGLQLIAGLLSILLGFFWL